MVTRLLAVLALVGVAATIGVMAGHTAVKRPDKGWRNGHDAGLKDLDTAVAAARREALAPYRRGERRYDAIYRAGRREGRRQGRKLGRSEALSTSRARRTLLPAFPGGWRAGHWYVVRLDPGPKGLRIGSRVLVSRGRLYGPCAADPDQICAAPPN